ncbi:MAG: RsmD family RNA methyltransferase [Salibacteraceae bacterium]
MRIINGKYRGRRITAPRNLPVRPTTDFAKEGLFNVLQHRLSFEGLQVLDLFSGTGNISFEFASRGAGNSMAVELNFGGVQFIKKTARDLEFEHLKVVRSEVFRFLKHNNDAFDLIFADPPYQLENLVQLPDAIFGQDRLLPGGMAIIEHPEEFDFSNHAHFEEHRRYGKVNFSIFA